MNPSTGRASTPRRRSTPVPAWVLSASRTLTSVILAIALVIVIVLIGRIAYGVHLPGATLPAFALAVHNLNGEKMTARFAPGEGDRTRVALNGAVARDKHPLAIGPEHRTESLGSPTTTAG